MGRGCLAEVVGGEGEEGGELPESRSSRCVFARAFTLCARSSGDWAAPGAPQDVFGLEVAVHHALGVHVLQREQDLAAAMRSHDKRHLEKINDDKRQLCRACILVPRTWRARSAAARSVSGPELTMRSSKSPPLAYCITRQVTPSSSHEKQSIILQMLSWSRPRRIAASCSAHLSPAMTLTATISPVDRTRALYTCAKVPEPQDEMHS